MTPLVFNDLAPISVPVEIAGKQYLLKEASEDAACRFRNARFEGAKLSDDGRMMSVGNMADVEPLLVSLCLFELYGVNGDTKERPVLLSQVRAWPPRVVKPLFEKVKEMSDGLEEKPTKESLTKQIEKLQALQGTLDVDPAKN